MVPPPPAELRASAPFLTVQLAALAFVSALAGCIPRRRWGSFALIAGVLDQLKLTLILRCETFCSRCGLREACQLRERLLDSTAAEGVPPLVSLASQLLGAIGPPADHSSIWQPYGIGSIQGVKRRPRSSIQVHCGRSPRFNPDRHVHSAVLLVLGLDLIRAGRQRYERGYFISGIEGILNPSESGTIGVADKVTRVRMVSIAVVDTLRFGGRIDRQEPGLVGVHLAQRSPEPGRADRRKANRWFGLARQTGKQQQPYPACQANRCKRLTHGIYPSPGSLKHD